MKNIAVAILLIFSGVQSYGQPQNDVLFTEKLFSSSFSDADKNIWPLKNNQYYTFLIQHDHYNLECMGADKKAYLIPKGEPLSNNLRLDAVMSFQKGSGKDGTAGLAVQLQANLESGYLIELNNEKEFRISRIQGAGSYKNLTPGKGGWVKNNNIKKTGKDNLISLIYNQGKLTFSINGKKVFEKNDEILPAGQNGIFISGMTKVSFKEYSFYGPASGTDSSSGLMTGDSLNSTMSTDIKTLTVSILQYKKENQQLKDKNEILTIELKENKQKVAEQQKFIQENLDLKLQAEMESLRKENEQLKQDLEKEKKENASGADLKKQLEGNKDADLVIVLSNNLKIEQETNKKLSDRVQYLEWQLRLCKSKNKK